VPIIVVVAVLSGQSILWKRSRKTEVRLGIKSRTKVWRRIAWFHDIYTVSQKTSQGVVVCSQVTLLQIVQWACQWKNFENRLIFGKDMDNIPSGTFFWDTV